MKIEATQGLPQMSVRYKRDRIAQYGLSVAELNTMDEWLFQVKKQVFFSKERKGLI